MGKVVGVLAADRLVTGLVEGRDLIGQLQSYPASGSNEGLEGLPADEIVEVMLQQIETAARGHTIDAVGVGFAGVIREGRVEESPNLQQTKGLRLAARLTERFKTTTVVNDADAIAAGIAARQGQLETLLRVWTLGDGIGFGRYPQVEGIGEGGHIVVTLDGKENFCGCGGMGHLEGIMGNAAMRRRFLDMEPDEVFTEAKAGDARCAAFVKLWHRALAAATATSVHLDGPGRFYLTGSNSRFVDLERLSIDLNEMVRMSSLQGSLFEIMPTSDELAVIGAAVSADRARFAL